MPVYSYKGVNQAGKPAKGSLSAESARAARAQMRSAGVFLTEITESSGNPTADKAGAETNKTGLNMEFNLPQRIPPLERAMATRQLSTLVSAGVPLVEALSALTAPGACSNRARRFAGTALGAAARFIEKRDPETAQSE